MGVVKGSLAVRCIPPSVSVTEQTEDAFLATESRSVFASPFETAAVQKYPVFGKEFRKHEFRLLFIRRMFNYCCYLFSKALS